MSTEEDIKEISAKFEEIIAKESSLGEDSTKIIYRELIFNKIKDQYNLSYSEVKKLFQNYYCNYLKNKRKNIFQNSYFFIYFLYLQIKEITTKRIPVILGLFLTFVIPLWNFYQQENDRIQVAKNSAIIEAKKARFEAWSIIRENEGRTGSLGRIEALEYLNHSSLYLSKPEHRKRCMPHNQEATIQEVDYGKLYNKQVVVQLNGVELSKAKLNHIKLPDASLEDSVFVGTDLVKANLCDAYLFGANLEKADLTEAILIDVDFTNARLNEATLTKANLTGAKLINAELKKADFQGATLTNVNLKKAILDGSKNLWDAELDDVTLNYASVKDANLEKANFKQTNFKGVQLDNSVLLKSDLSQVTNLSEQQLTGNNPPYLCATSLPQNLQIDGDRDCERLVDHFSEKKGESREESRKYIDKVRME